MTERARASFLDLPAEIRNQIYHLSLFHFETNGIISPSVHSKWPSVTLVEDVRIMILEGRPLKSEDGVINPLLDFNTTANARSGHFCSPKCLLQPALTRLCRQIRREALPIFYGVNRFHLEMDGCALTTTEGHRVHTSNSENHMWTPQWWWRAIGDTNLRLIDKLSFVCQPHNESLQRGNHSLEYCRSTRTADTYIYSILPCEVRSVFDPNVGFTGSNDENATAYEKWRYRKAYFNYGGGESDGGKGESNGAGGEQKASAEKNQEDMEYLCTHGLNVCVLERLIVRLEPNDAEYVTDHAAFGLSMIVGRLRPEEDADLHSETDCNSSGKPTYADVVKKSLARPTLTWRDRQHLNPKALARKLGR